MTDGNEGVGAVHSTRRTGEPATGRRIGARGRNRETFAIRKGNKRLLKPSEISCTRQIHTLQEAIEKMKWYCLRWRIEIYFKVLKSGFKVEDCRLQTADRLIRYLAVMSVVAWQVYWLALVSRTAPEITSDIFLSDFEWKILFTKFNPNEKIPKQPPTMKQITIWIARL